MKDKTLKHECACSKKHTDIDNKELARIIEKECGCDCGCSHSKGEEDTEFASENFSGENTDCETEYSKEAKSNQYGNVDFVDESAGDRLECSNDIYFGENGRYTEDGFTADNLYTMIPSPQGEDVVSTQES